jgi:chromosome segregation ATPase
MSRRRDMTPTLERKDGQLETLARQLAREQAKNRDLRRELRDAQRAHLAVSEQLQRVHADCERRLAELEATHEEAQPPAPEPARSWHQRLFSKLTPT